MAMRRDRKTPAAWTSIAVFIALASSAVVAQTISAPEPFVPGAILQASDNTAPSFFPGDRVVVFQHDENKTSVLQMSQKVNDRWTTPVTTSFSGRWRDLEPTVATDGSYIIFASSRPADGGSEALTGRWGGKEYPGRGGNLWRVNRKPDGTWDGAKPLPSTVNLGAAVFEPSLASDGTLYFMRPDEQTGKFRLFSANPRDGYATVIPLSFWQPGITDADPAVAPDQSYLVFGSSRGTPGRLSLFISFRDSAGWSRPMILPSTINGASSVQDAHLSAGQTTLYFTRDGGIRQTPFQPILAWARMATAVR